MRLFLYEYTTAVTPRDGSLAKEGWAMLSAIVEDFSRIPGVHTTTLVDAGRKRRLGHQCIAIPPEAEQDKFRELARLADYTLVIAPEFDGLLERRCRWVLEAGGRLLGSSPDAVALTADKLALAEHLKERSVPTPVTVPFSTITTCPSPKSFPAVCKPRYGAGAQATFLVQTVADLLRLESVARSPWSVAKKKQAPSATDYGLRTTDFREFILQPFIPGQSASVAFLIGSVGMQPLLPATQKFLLDGRFQYLGGRIPLPGDLADRAIHLGRRALETVPGLGGYVGVDLVLGTEPDGGKDSVIEINPRLTTSYIGLRRLARGNLAVAMLETVIEAKPPELEWAPTSVSFRCDGRVFAV